MLSVRGGLSDLLTEEGVAYMRSLNERLETVTVENIGHAPMLDEPEAWDAILSFLAKVP
jgi:pimeloyl-ACP methyl ester carboxylesterase